MFKPLEKIKEPDYLLELMLGEQPKQVDNFVKVSEDIAKDTDGKKFLASHSQRCDVMEGVKDLVRSY